MKKFWNKTKKSFAIGIAKTDAAINDRELESDPDFLDKVTKLKALKSAMREFTHEANDLAEAIKHIGSVQESLAKALKDSISGDDNMKEFSEAGLEIGHKIDLCAENAGRYYIPTYVLGHINEVMEEIKQLDLLKDKTHKNRILLDNEQEKLEHARKHEKDVEEHEREYEKRTEKHNQYFEQFKQGVTELWERRLEIYKRAYQGLQYYFMDFTCLANETAKEKLPQFDKEALKEVYGDLSISPPEISPPPVQSEPEKESPPPENEQQTQ